MSVHRARLRPLYIPQRKHVEFEQPSNLKGGHLSPDLQPSTPPTFPTDNCHSVSQIGKFLLLDPIDQNGTVHIYKSLHLETQQEFTCKVIPIHKYRETLSAYWRVGCHDNIVEVEEILLGETQAYVFFPRNYGDLHSYVRSRRKLKEAEAMRLFQQIIDAVSHCHENGVVLRDLKLRKFVFKDPEKKQIMLEGLEDACVLEDEADDQLSDKHGCPAYVSPEILHLQPGYSGKQADIWSVGVMLYTMLVGRYPFHDVEPSALFSKIRRGQFTVPDTVSSRAKCLIRSLLRREPGERLTADEVLQHPWFRGAQPYTRHARSSELKDLDQTVPDIIIDQEDSIFT